MGSKMLVDASHPEETRVVVARGSRIEEFDFESASRRPLKGNIYLAKVTRVEPSLQAAFVDYGGNRHGFLAFAEIHPDYYQIPIADRLALIREQEEEDAEDDDDNGDQPAAQSSSDEQPNGETLSSGASDTEDGLVDDEPARTLALDAEAEPHLASDIIDAMEPAIEQLAEEQGERPTENVTADIVSIEEDAENQKIESIGAEDALEEVPQRHRRQPRRRYKIQEVIKRRQILLVQVVKEERGNKGAALTTYMSLAGRYCVLMPNTARGGGISRKITDANDRRRLKEVAKDVEVPQGMGLIVRTAGAQRTRPEIKRDFDYLMRLWESVRDLTLKSTAPCLVYEEGNLIKRSIRDLYTKDVDEVIVEGEEAYRDAKDFMKMLMPSHAKNVKLYKDTRPLFSRYQVENHLDGLFSPSVTLPSGGYIVINQTEALVSIDINSGKATREHSIEDTAVKTNLESCDEIARQLRLRDLAGLVVIDFIDMEENRNNRAVERRLKDALKHDRARIQVGRISHFGLLEMSRQRLRPGLIEGTFRTCPHCEGRGIVRSVSSCGLGVLRAIEDHLLKRQENLTVRCARDVAFYLLNEKRDNMLALEQAHNITIFVVPGGEELKGTQALIERAGERDIAPRRLPASAPVRMDSAFEDEAEAASEDMAAEADEAEEIENVTATPSSDRNGDSEKGDGRKRRRRGGRWSERDRNGEAANETSVADARAPSGESDDDERSNATLAEVDDRGDQVDESVKDDRPTAADEQSGDSPQRNDGRRGRFGRKRGRRGGREERGGQEGGERSPNGRGRDRNNDAERPRHDGHRDRANAEQPMFVAPAPATQIIIPDVIAEPEPRKWQPPQPTVAADVAARKAGWWSKRK